MKVWWKSLSQREQRLVMGPGVLVYLLSYIGGSGNQ